MAVPCHVVMSMSHITLGTSHMAKKIKKLKKINNEKKQRLIRDTPLTMLIILLWKGPNWDIFFKNWDAIDTFVKTGPNWHIHKSKYHSTN